MDRSGARCGGAVVAEQRPCRTRSDAGAARRSAGCGRSHRRLSRRRLGTAAARARSPAARAARTGAVPALSAGRRRAAACDRLCAWRRLHAGQPRQLGRDAARTGARQRCGRPLGRLPARAGIPFSGGLRGDRGDDPPDGARGRRARHRSGAACRRRRFGGRQSGAGIGLGLRDAGERLLRFLLLIYGVYSTDTESPSWQRFGKGAGLSQTQMRWIWETYLDSPDQASDWRVAPLNAALAGLPPAHLVVGRLDPLLDDSLNLKARLDAAGVPATLAVIDGLNHGFIRYGRLIASARRALAECAAALGRALATP